MARRRHYNGFYMTDALQQKLNTAFVCLRKLGLIARQNFSCCGGCGGGEIAGYAGEKVKKDERQRTKIKGCVFYHKQDTETLHECGKLYLRYGQVDSTEVGKIGLPTEQVGQLVVDVLSTLDIPYEWNGDESSCIIARLDLIGKEMAIIPFIPTVQHFEEATCQEA